MAKALTDQDWLDFYQKQQAQAQRGYLSGDGNAASYLPQLNDLQSKISALQAKTNPAPNGTLDPVADAKIRVTKDTEGRGDATMNDPYVTAALQRLDQVSSGKDAPFTQQVQDQMLAARAGSTAASEAAQTESMREAAAANGGNAADPSFRAAQRQLHAQSQSQNLNDLGQIQTQAQISNFGARQDATRSLDSARMGQIGEANRNYNQGAGYYAQTQQQGNHVPGFNYQSQPLLRGIGAAYGNFQYQPPQASSQPTAQPAQGQTDPAFQFQPMDDSSWATGAVDNSGKGGTPFQAATSMPAYTPGWSLPPQQPPVNRGPRQLDPTQQYTYTF